MRINITIMARSLAFAIAIAAFLTLSHGTARADEVTLSGVTTGTVTGVPQLTFTGNNFTGTTFANVGALSGSNNLGTFFLSTAPGQLVAGSFTLNITFTVPGGIAGGQSATFTGSIVGSVSPNINQGGLNVHFNQPPGGTAFTFSDGGTNGSFSLIINDVFVQSGQSAPILAGLTGSQTSVPEPATLLLLGTGLAGVASKLRQRRRAGKKSE